MTDIAILIPVLGRPEQIHSVLASIAETTTLDYRPVLICSPGDEEVMRAARDTDADTIIVSWSPGKADFAKKINYAFEATEEEWLLQAATDLRFHPRWDIHAMRKAERGFGVIGTNDLGNPLVKRGNHSTHTLFSRSYINEYGGTADNTGAVFSETYDHQWVDNEFVQTALLRRQFVFSARSVIEHLHVHWGKAQMDPTYEKAMRATNQDRRLHTQRMRMVRNRVMREERRRSTSPS